MLYFAIIKKGKNKFGEDEEKIFLDKSIDSVVKDVSQEVKNHLLSFEESKKFYEFPTRLINRLKKEQKWWRYNHKLDRIEKIVEDEWKTPNVERIFTDAWNNAWEKFKKETIRLI